MSEIVFVVEKDSDNAKVVVKSTLNMSVVVPDSPAGSVVGGGVFLGETEGVPMRRRY